MQGTITFFTRNLSNSLQFREATETFEHMGFRFIPEQSFQRNEGEGGIINYATDITLALDDAPADKVLNLVAYATKNGYVVADLTLPTQARAKAA